MTGALKLMRDDALRLVAAEIEAFTRTGHHSLERYAPYVAWARQLTQQDTIITFNYDDVPEIIRCDNHVNMDVLWTFEDGAFKADSTKVLKMHGSVHWRWRDGRIRIDQQVHPLASRT